MQKDQRDNDLVAQEERTDNEKDSDLFREDKLEQEDKGFKTSRFKKLGENMTATSQVQGEYRFDVLANKAAPITEAQLISKNWEAKYYKAALASKFDGLPVLAKVQPLEVISSIQPIPTTNPEVLNNFS